MTGVRTAGGPQGRRDGPTAGRAVLWAAPGRLRCRRDQDRTAGPGRPHAGVGPGEVRGASPCGGRWSPGASARSRVNLREAEGQELVREADRRGGHPRRELPARERSRSGASLPTTCWCSTRGSSSCGCRDTARPGPYADRPGYGAIGEAMGGLRAVIGEPDRPPARAGHLHRRHARRHLRLRRRAGRPARPYEHGHAARSSTPRSTRRCSG